jgi:hypothetical protein
MTYLTVHTPSGWTGYELNSTTRSAIAWAKEEIEAIHPDWDEYEIAIVAENVYFMVE